MWNTSLRCHGQVRVSLLGFDSYWGHFFRTCLICLAPLWRLDVGIRSSLTAIFERVLERGDVPPCLIGLVWVKPDAMFRTGVRLRKCLVLKWIKPDASDRVEGSCTFVCSFLVSVYRQARRLSVGLIWVTNVFAGMCKLPFCCVRCP